MAFRIERHPEAFTNSLGKRRRPREHSKAHLDFIRSLPCVITGKRPVEACHIRYADPIYGKREVGGAEKPDDRWTVPMCPEKHREQHNGNERAFWQAHNLDPLAIASALWGCNRDEELGEQIVKAANMRATGLPVGKDGA